MQLLEELKKQSSGAEIHLSDVSALPRPFSLHVCVSCLHKIVLMGSACMFVCFSSQLRNALATLASEGFVVVHGDTVKRIWWWLEDDHGVGGLTLLIISWFLVFSLYCEQQKKTFLGYGDYKIIIRPRDYRWFVNAFVLTKLSCSMEVHELVYSST